MASHNSRERHISFMVPAVAQGHNLQRRAALFPEQKRGVCEGECLTSREGQGTERAPHWGNDHLVPTLLLLPSGFVISEESLL